MDIPDILQQIIDVKIDEVSVIKRKTPLLDLKSQVRDTPLSRGFLNALKTKQQETGHVALIAEVKKASPSKGIIREDFNPAWIAERYQEGGAACLSVLTDKHFFQGSMEYMKQARHAVEIPVLRKDFMIDPIQLYEARAAGADCILLIAACLEPTKLQDLHGEAQQIGLDVLVEFHNEAEWQGVIATSLVPPLCGINNRNLRTFKTSLSTTDNLAPAITSKGAFLVSESGIFTPDDVQVVKDAGASGILVGESLMRQPDPGKAAKELLEN